MPTPPGPTAVATASAATRSAAASGSPASSAAPTASNTGPMLVTARRLTEHEHAVIERLIEVAPDAEQQRLRAAAALVQWARPCPCACGTIDLFSCDDADDAQYPLPEHRLVVEGWLLRDPDEPVGVMLFASDDRLVSVEVYVHERVDGDPPFALPRAEDIVVPS